MKKVLFVATVPGHINAFHLPYLKYFKEEGYEVHVASSRSDHIDYCDKNIVISIKRNPFKLSNIKAIIELRKIIIKEQYDIIHCHTPMGGVVARLAAKKSRKKGTRVIYTAHGFHFYKGAPLLNWLLYYPVEKYLSKHTDTLITINKEDYNLAKSKFKAVDIEYVPGVGIDPKKIDVKISENEKETLKKELNIKENDFIILSIGELNDNKNQIMQIEAMKILVKKNPNIKLLLAGTGNKQFFLESKIKEYSLSNNVKLLGFRKDIPKLLKIVDLVLSTSKREGLPVNVMEALSNGIPVIGTNCRGTRDLIQPAKNGYIVEIDDINFMCKCILEVVRKNITISSKSNIYMLPNIMKKMTNIYNPKRRVLHILSSNKYSGAENVACMIINNSKEKYKSVYCSPIGSIEESLKEKRIEYFGVKKLSIKELKKIIKKFNPHIIHCHDYRASCYGALFSKNRKIIAHIHGNNKVMNNLNFKTLLFCILSKKFNKIIFVSKSCLEDLYFKKTVKDKSIILYNVIDNNAILNKIKEKKINKHYDLIFLGRLAYPKNPERLIKIINMLKQQKENIRIAIVGDGNERESIESLVKKLNLSKNIKFYGFQKNPFPILNNSKIMIMTSIYEGTPMCALEAQSLGKPIISTPVDGLKDLIINDVNGFLSDSDEEICQKILMILNNQKEYEKMSKNSINKFREFNDVNKYIDTIDKIYFMR